MPQVHNKSLNDTAFGKDSRYMSSLRFSDKTLRRVNVLNALENRLNTKKVNFFQRDSAYKVRKLDRVKERLVDNTNKRMAYKLVLKTNSFSEIKDKQKALNKRYSFTAFHNEVKEMMRFMKPELVRERKSKLLSIENRLKYEIVLSQNRQKFNKLVPEKRTWIPRHMQAIYEAEEKERQRKERERQEEEAKKAKDDRGKRGLATLRRRIITIDSTPNSPTKSPAIKTPVLKTPTLKTPMKTPRERTTKTPSKTPLPRTPSPVKTPSIVKQPSQANLLKPQGITMNMMKKQKSFIETKERTMSPTFTGNNSERVQNDVKKLSDVNNNDVDNVSAISHESSGQASAKKGQETKNNRRLKTTKLPVLPPIESHRTPREDGATSSAGAAKENSKQIKLPSLKMTQNN